MPSFGSHLSVAGGLYKAVDAAVKLDITSLQIFTHSPSQWAVKPDDAGGWVGKTHSDEDVARYQEALAKAKLSCVMAHDSYLINLAAPDETLFNRSLEAFVHEVQRADRLGLQYLVTHPGAATDGDEAVGLDKVAAALDEVHRRTPNAKVMILLETTAGMGKSLGHRFEHLGHILNKVKQPERLGVCLDTCHIYAAGYELAPKKSYLATFKEFDKLVGIERLKAFHINDSKKPLGSRVDRHEHIGKGHLGLEPFQLLVNDRRFRNHPMILETAKEDDMDVVNLSVLRGLCGK